MSILHFFTLTLLLTCASINAMDQNVEIVPFNKEKHLATVSALLQETFKRPTLNKRDIVSVLVQKNRSTRRTPAEKILGCISYYNTRPSRLSAPRITTIKYLVVAKEHRNKGYGKHLLRHVEDYARKNNMDKIVGTSTPCAMDFYRTLGARQEDENPWKLSINVSQPNNPPAKEDQASDLERNN